MQTLVSDIRYASRNLLRSRGFAIVAALTLAVGIGANTAIFSIIDTILLRPLPYRSPDQLVRLNETESAPGRYPFAGPDFVDWKAQNQTFQDMALYSWPGDMNLSGQGRPEHVRTVPTAANFFSVLGVEPLLGRTWTAGEDQPGKDQVTILAYGFWRSHFAGDPRAVGQTVELNSKKYTVIGVMPEGFRYFPNAQLWIPLDMSTKGLGQRGSHWANAIGRLKPGVTLQAAQADLTVIATRLEKQYPDSNYKVGATTRLLRDDLVGDSRNSLVLMLSAVGLVLLIACANVANLLLSRAISRQKEIAVRSALGAGRLRIVRQLLTESMLLAIVGGIMGLLLGWGIIAIFSRTKSLSLPQFNIIQLNGAVLAFTFALAVVTGILFGMFPAFQMSRPDLHEELKGGAGSSISPNRRRRFTSNILVVGEIALALLLVVSAGLLLKDFARLRNMDIGIRPEGVWTAAVQLPETNYETPRQQFQFAQSLLQASQHLPGVEFAALTNRLPLEGGSNYYINIRGRVSERGSGPLVETHSVSDDYFQVMGIRLLRGRVFNALDAQASLALSERFHQAHKSGTLPPTEVMDAMIVPTIINESMARHFWPNENPLGQMFSNGGPHGPWRQVVGVVSDVRQWGLTNKPVPEAYDPFNDESRPFLAVRTSLPPSQLTAPVRKVLGQIDPSLPLFSVRTMDDVMADNAQGQRFLSILVGSFAALALLLSAMGIYGVLSYAVTQRTREIGIRMSLGASRGRVLADILREGMLLAVIGFAVGIAGAFAGGKVLSSLLHEVQPRDPAILIGTTGLLALVALLACLIPARRAAKLDPISALRYE